MKRAIERRVRVTFLRIPTRASGGFLMLQPTDLPVEAEMPTRASGGSLTLQPSLLGLLATYQFQFRVVLGPTHRPQREAPTAVACGHLARACDSVGFNIKNPPLSRVGMDSSNANSSRPPLKGSDRESESRSMSTRVFLEAFFHARFFLEMAVKYGKELPASPTLLPSGWAALLCLYNIR